MGLIEKTSLILQRAYEVAQAATTIDCEHKDFIDYVIDNNHLTFKYILFTALLSKAADESINTLCLQKGSSLTGAYDARSVCHKVIVPFEMETLEKVLGGSNEPFLNKPARFPELKKTNPVRKGNDQKILNSLCDNLPLISTSEEALVCTEYLLWKLIRIKEEKQKLTVFTVPESSNNPSRLFSFINKALSQSFEGEILTLMVAGMYHLLYNTPDVLVEVHPVNQCGASGKEISDLDVYLNGELIASNELKDKDFAETDVRHAADKVLQSGGTKMLFITGPRSSENKTFIDALQKEYQDKNFMLRVISYSSFFSSAIGIVSKIDTHDFLLYILNIAHETKFKEEVISYIDDLAKTELGISR